MTTVKLTDRQKMVYDVILENAVKNQKTKYREIIRRTNLNPPQVTKVLHGDASNDIKGLYDLVPSLRGWVEYIRHTRMDRVEVDPTFFYEHEAGIVLVR